MVFLFSEFNGDPAIRFFLGGGGLGNVGGGGKRMPDHRIFHRVGPPTGFAPFFRNKFPGLFPDFSRPQIEFSRTLKFTLTLSFPRSQC